LRVRGAKEQCGEQVELEEECEVQAERKEGVGDQAKDKHMKLGRQGKRERTGKEGKGGAMKSKITLILVRLRSSVPACRGVKTLNAIQH